MSKKMYIESLSMLEAYYGRTSYVDFEDMTRREFIELFEEIAGELFDSNEKYEYRIEIQVSRVEKGDDEE